MIYSWILDSGGAGRGAWQGGVIYEFMPWCRENGCFPSIFMGASAGGYAAADVATGTERTVLKGWSRWGKEDLPPLRSEPAALRSLCGIGRFRAHLRASIRYVMGKSELSGIFQSNPEKKLLVFTTRVRRRDMNPFGSSDLFRIFFKSATRKFPKALKFLPGGYVEDPVIFATHLPPELRSEYVRPLSPRNFPAVIEASCLVPIAMGSPLSIEELQGPAGNGPDARYPGDHRAVFMDGGFALKMPMRVFGEDPRFQHLASWSSTRKAVVFCCDPLGNLWETSSRLRSLNALPSVIQAVRENRLMILCPDHQIEAGFLCTDNAKIMRTFSRGREQAQQMLRSDPVRRFFGAGD